MQTTLRLDTRLYRDAKAAAAREGTTLTHFIEGALRQKLGRGGGRPRPLPVYDSRVALPPGFDLAQAIREEETQYSVTLAGRAAPRRTGRQAT
jgi:hypothetical protein